MKFCLTLAKAKYTYSRYQILRLFPHVCHCSQYSWHMAISTVQQEKQIKRSAKFLFPGCVYFCLALPGWCLAKQKNFLAAPCSYYLQWNVQFHLETGFLKEGETASCRSRLKMQFRGRHSPQIPLTGQMVWCPPLWRGLVKFPTKCRKATLPQQMLDNCLFQFSPST